MDSSFKSKLMVIIGLIGSIGCISLFMYRPSFPKPDMILILALFVGLVFRQAKQTLICLAPLVVLLLAYESFRGSVPAMIERANFMFMPGVDRIVTGGELPTKLLQNWWWRGDVQWYDFALYVPYLLHFVLPFALAIIIWKKFQQEYWRYVTALVGISFIAFFVFLVFPAAPPWMASDYGLIEPIERISSSVWLALGIQDFASLYNEVSPNPVAAVPSLHAGYATLFSLFVVRLFSSRWKYIAWIYPLLIYIGTIYQGEHYVIDAVLGAMLAAFGFHTSPYVTRKIALVVQTIKVQLVYSFRYVDEFIPR